MVVELAKVKPLEEKEAPISGIRKAIAKNFVFNFCT